MPPCGSRPKYSKLNVGKVFLASVTAIVNSPSTTVAVRNEAETDAGARLGSRARRKVVAPTSAETPRGVDQGPNVDRLDAGVDRPVGERQRHHDVERHERPCPREEPAGVGAVERGDAGRQRDRRHDVGEHGQELDQRAGPRQPAGARTSAVGTSSASVITTVASGELEARLQRRPEVLLVEDPRQRPRTTTCRTSCPSSGAASAPSAAPAGRSRGRGDEEDRGADQDEIRPEPGEPHAHVARGRPLMSPASVRRACAEE